MPKSELVNDMKLSAQVRKDGTTEVTEHRYQSDSTRETTGRWPEPEVWKRGERLGKGAFGTVWVEKCVSAQGSTRTRAVKVILQTSDPLRKSSCDQELEAVAKFSQPKVGAITRFPFALDVNID